MRLLALVGALLLFGCSSEPPVEIRVWADPKRGVWEFQYPGEDGEWDTADDRGSTNRAIFPAGRDVELEIESYGPAAAIAFPELGVSERSPTTFLIWDSKLRRDEKLKFFCGEYIGWKSSEMEGWARVLEFTEWERAVADLPRW